MVVLPRSIRSRARMSSATRSARTRADAFTTVPPSRDTNGSARLATRRAVTRLGHWDPAHRIIVISRRLDDPGIPDYVLRFIIFHEMLHVAVPSMQRGRRTNHHTKAFREAEQKFVDYDRAKWFIEKKLARE